MNEYLQKFEAMRANQLTGYGYFGGVEEYGARKGMTEKYAWAVPSQEALDEIAKYGPIIEMGAGTGYWAYLLLQMGVVIIPFDSHPPYDGEDEDKRNAYRHKESWTKVHQGSHEKLAEHPECHTLFLCWPPYADPMAADCLKAFKGSTLIYIGESAHGCTGDHEFHELLHEEWEEVKWIVLPQFEGSHDCLSVYVRKSPYDNPDDLPEGS
jgi:hypothetical protein